MTDALRYEWTRVTTLRSTFWLIGLAVLLSAGVAFLFGFYADSGLLDVRASVLTGGSTLIQVPLTAVFLAILGIFATGHEYRHNTIQPTLIAMPRRGQLLAAKALVTVLVAIVITAVSLAVNALIGVLTLGGDTLDLGDSDLQAVIAGYLVLVVLWTLFGLAMAQLFRGVPAALVLLFIIPLVVEPIVIGLSFIPALDWLESVVPYLPFTAGQSLTAVPSTLMTGGPPGQDAMEMLGRWEGGGVMAIYVVVLLAVATILFRRRDA